MLTLQQPPRQVQPGERPARSTLREPRGRLRNETGGTFRLLCGIHLDYGPPNCQCDACYFWEQERQADLAAKKPDRGPCPNHRYEAYDDYTNTTGSVPRLGGYIARVHKASGKLPPHPDALDPDTGGPALSREEYVNDIIVSKRDLDRLHNGSRMDMQKYERLNGATQMAPAQLPPPEPFPLEQMNVAQLLAVAAEEETDLSSVMPKDKNAAIKKEDLVRLLKNLK